MAGKTSRRDRPNTATCAYCGAAGATLRDHVPPRGLFASTRPPNLIVVSACAACHRPASGDDDYFRLALATRPEVAPHPDGSGGLLEDALRSLTRVPEEQGFARSFMRSVQIVTLRSPAGLDVGAAVNRPDAPRLLAVVDRIVRGLFFHHTGRVLGPRAAVMSLENTLTDLTQLTTDHAAALAAITRGLAASEWRYIGRGFSYANWVAPDHPQRSAWLLRFYGTMTFLTLTGPMDNA